MSYETGIGVAYRLTPDDERAIAQAMRTTVAYWQSHMARPINENQRCEWMPALIRIGYHAIGCGEADLRDLELSWIEGAAEQVLQPDGWRSPCFDSPDWPRWTPPDVEALFDAVIHVLSGDAQRCYPCYCETLAAEGDTSGMDVPAFETPGHWYGENR